MIKVEKRCGSNKGGESIRYDVNLFGDHALKSVPATDKILWMPELFDRSPAQDRSRVTVYSL